MSVIGNVRRREAMLGWPAAEQEAFVVEECGGDSMMTAESVDEMSVEHHSS